jgi:hypothetical protein
MLGLFIWFLLGFFFYLLVFVWFHPMLLEYAW